MEKSKIIISYKKYVHNRHYVNAVYRIIETFVKSQFPNTNVSIWKCGLRDNGRIGTVSGDRVYWMYECIVTKPPRSECITEFPTPGNLMNFIKATFFKNCNICTQTIPIADAEFYVGQYFCKKCENNAIINCRGCGNQNLQENNSIDFSRINGQIGWYCTSCANRYRSTSSNQLRHRSWKQTVIGTGIGTKVQSERGWSAEIECYLTDTDGATAKINELPTSFGIGRDGSLDHSIGKKMKDGRKYQVGIEIQTPILKGAVGEDYLKNICKALNYKDNAQVDNWCGLHLHIDMADCYTNTEVLKKLLAFHWIYEPVMMSFLPATRRANQYCQSLKNDYSIKLIPKVGSYDELYKLWYKKNESRNRYDKKHPRYHGINLHSVFKFANVEIRYHSGTTNPTKIFHWANLHTKIIDYCMGKIGEAPEIDKIISEGLTQFGKPRSLSRLTNQLFDLLKLSEECQQYLKDRQKKFKLSEAQEVEFIEKDEKENGTSEIIKKTSTSKYQLTLANYRQLLMNNAIANK